MPYLILNWLYTLHFNLFELGVILQDFKWKQREITGIWKMDRKLGCATPSIINIEQWQTCELETKRHESSIIRFHNHVKITDIILQKMKVEQTWIHLSIPIHLLVCHSIYLFQWKFSSIHHNLYLLHTLCFS